MTEVIEVLLPSGTPLAARFVPRSVGGHVAAAQTPLSVVIAPDFAVPASMYADVAQAFALRGVSVMIPEMPSVASNHEDHAHMGYRRLANEILPALIDATRSVEDCGPIVLLGHGTGGHWLMTYLALGRPDLLPDAPVALIHVSVGMPSMPRGWRLRHVPAVVQRALCSAANTRFGVTPGAGQGVPSGRSAQMVQDWEYLARQQRFELVDVADDMERALRQVSLPLLAVDVDRDKLTDQASVENMLAVCSGAQITRLRLEQPPGHWQWLAEPSNAVSQMVTWLRAVTEQAIPTVHTPRMPTHDDIVVHIPIDVRGVSAD